MTLKASQILEVQRLLARRPPLSLRAIARQLAVTRDTIQKIARGKHPLQRDGAPLAESPPGKTKPRRCPEGHLVVISPCVICAAAAAAAHRASPGGKRFRAELNASELKIELVGPPAERYRELLAQKIAESQTPEAREGPPPTAEVLLRRLRRAVVLLFFACPHNVLVSLRGRKKAQRRSG